MKYIDIQQYAPHKVFLLQGDENTYETFVSEALLENPYLFSLSCARLTMDHARSISEYCKNGDGTNRVCIVYFSIFSIDAAQVLLKTFEEPDLDTTIVLVTSYPYTVPQTIRSRVQMFTTSNTAITNLPFQNRKDALEYIKKEFDADADDGATRRAHAINVLDALEAHAKNDTDRVRAVYEAKHMLFFANMPPKYVLEYVVTMVLS